ncbi:UTP--glucose-1-phosphate uridylyltransferase [Nematocida major]|uniref:UTP--glucose-1-phosphate uridylyltransferase n=1 Tax=Nematocida major TaxID=1912982 RepID=UPI00200810F7|nr:UTP--glucose-1-phosphate uridylyltransferase [Nematocida major]KAH9386097.1 UTP--glucose-1-phosphate uridylyltransferase [Nematocida major]
MEDNNLNETPRSVLEGVDKETLERVDTAYEFQQRGAESTLPLMEEELSLLKKHKHATPENLRKFSKIFSRYLKTRSKKIDWDRISPPPAEMMVEYESIVSEASGEAISEMLNKLAVLKLNGGLGTSMGCTGPKSAIEVKDYLNFIDLTVRQLEHFNTKYSATVPLILMNSYNTHEQTSKLVSKYKGIWTFEQSTFPRIFASTLMPVLSDPSVQESDGWYPPGHGDLFESLNESGMLDRLLDEGKEYLFVSNVDNLKAGIDLSILQYVIRDEIDFLMEVTKKTRADVKGGTLIEYDSALRLLEIAQVPDAHKTDFTSLRKFKIFNTNSIWVNLRALKKILDQDIMELEIIENKKKLPNGESVIQLETAIGASIKYFSNSRGLVVPRSRFLPVKTCSDLMLLQSTLFKISHGTLAISPSRISDSIPIIRLLGGCFKTVSDYRKHVMGPVIMDELEHLTISGNVTIGKHVELKGTVIIVAEDGKSIDIPDGSVLDDKVIIGHLRIVDH